MYKITQEELKTIVEKHRHWLHRDCDGWKNMCADLSFTDLSGMDLRGMDLRCADLSYTLLTNANLSGTDLSGANLSYADLHDADLRYVKNMPDVPYACPKTGSFIGWKKAESYIVKLEIPEDAKRSSSTGEKCRCNKARVLGIETYEGEVVNKRKVASYFDPNFIYEVGKMVEVDDFDDNRWNDCTHGIHFFMDRIDAMNY